MNVPIVHECLHEHLNVCVLSVCVACVYLLSRAALVAQQYRIHLPMQKMQVRSPGQEDAPEKEMAAYSSILPWEIP